MKEDKYKSLHHNLVFPMYYRWKVLPHLLSNDLGVNMVTPHWGGQILYPVEVLSPPVDKEYLSLSLSLFFYVHFTLRRKANQF